MSHLLKLVDEQGKTHWIEQAGTADGHALMRGEASLDREANSLVSSLRAAWRDDFNGAALDPEKWAVLAQGAGQTITLAGGELTLAAGTAANENTILRCLTPLSIPVRAWFIGRISQRIANQTFFLELVNAAGDMAARWVLDGTSATVGKYQATNGGNGAVSAGSTINTSASDSILEIELFVDEAWFATRGADTANGKTYNLCLTRNVPDPNETYYLQIRALNGAAAPASNTNLVLGAVCVQDINELTAEITGGRGDTVSAKAIAVTVSGSVVQSHATSFGVTAQHKAISAASTNATSVKTTSGTLASIIATNLAATTRFLKVYNKTSAPTVGTDVPVWVFPLAAGQTLNIQSGIGLRLSAGIAYAITAGLADSDTTAIGANEVVVNLSYT